MNLSLSSSPVAARYQQFRELGERVRYRTNVLAYPGCAHSERPLGKELAAHATVKEIHCHGRRNLLLMLQSAGDVGF